MNKRVFDCFIFFNELELLEIRLNEIYDHVDYFVICEATQTFQGNQKSLIFRDNQDRFSGFLDKIIHIVVDDMPDTTDLWVRENFQRNCLRRGLEGLGPEDVVVISDLDEIVSPKTIEELRLKSGYFLIVVPMYQFFLNMLETNDWDKVYAFSYRLNDKIPDLSDVRVRQVETFERFGEDAHKITNGGWHFTFLGGAGKVREKLSAYSHVGEHYDTMREAGAAERQLEAGYSVGGEAVC